LTDLDWSPELSLACHDDDEQNARLAQHIWEDNGLDTPETFLKDLMPFLGLTAPLSIRSVLIVDLQSTSAHMYGPAPLPPLLKP
jgi:hypothetical protein